MKTKITQDIGDSNEQRLKETLERHVQSSCSTKKGTVFNREEKVGTKCMFLIYRKVSVNEGKCRRVM